MKDEVGHLSGAWANVVDVHGEEVPQPRVQQHKRRGGRRDIQDCGHARAHHPSKIGSENYKLLKFWIGKKLKEKLGNFEYVQNLQTTEWKQNNRKS